MPCPADEASGKDNKTITLWVKSRDTIQSMKAEIQVWRGGQGWLEVCVRCLRWRCSGTSPSVAHTVCCMQRKEGIPSNEQRLNFGGKPLRDGCTLAHYCKWELSAGRDPWCSGMQGGPCKTQGASCPVAGSSAPCLSHLPVQASRRSTRCTWICACWAGCALVIGRRAMQRGSGCSDASGLWPVLQHCPCPSRPAKPVHGQHGWLGGQPVPVSTSSRSAGNDPLCPPAPLPLLPPNTQAPEHHPQRARVEEVGAGAAAEGRARSSAGGLSRQRASHPCCCHGGWRGRRKHGWPAMLSTRCLPPSPQPTPAGGAAAGRHGHLGERGGERQRQRRR